MSDELMVTITVSQAQLEKWLKAERFYQKGLDAWGLKELVRCHFGYSSRDEVPSGELYERHLLPLLPEWPQPKGGRR